MEKRKDRVLLASGRGDISGRLLSKLSESWEVQTASTQEQLYFLAQQWEPKVIITDSLLGSTDTLRAVRDLYPIDALGIIFVALGSPSSTTTLLEREAFSSGVDYFIVEREHLVEAVTWRVQILVKRLSGTSAEKSTTTSNATPVTEFNNLEIFPKDHFIKRDGSPIELTPLQFKLLVTFASHKEHLLSRDWLRTVVWGDAKISPRSIDAHISKLKKTLPELNGYLKNIYGKGYILTEKKSSAA